MAKVLGFLGILFFLTSQVGGGVQSLPFTLGEFPIQLIRVPNLVTTQTIANDDVTYHHAFRHRSKGFELRYSLFKSTGPVNSSIRQAFQVFSMVLAMNGSGKEVPVSEFSMYNDQDVLKEFNGQFGSTVVIASPTSSFARPFKFIMMSFFFKENHGIVCQSILFNSIQLVEDEEFWNAFHSFRFYP